VHAWLSRLRHDLVKRAVWAARDLRDAARELRPADVAELRRGLFDLRDGEGRTVDAAALWERFRADAPEAPAAALDAFGAAVVEAQRALSAPSASRAALDAVLRIETAFADLARTLEEE
jgi:hypothetical protein